MNITHLPAIFANKKLQRTILTFLTRSSGAGAAFVLNIIVARVLNIADAGYFFSSLSVVTIAYALSRLGLGYSTYRVTAELTANGLLSRLKDLCITVTLTVSLASIVVSIFLVIFARELSIAIFGRDELYFCLSIMALSIPLYCVGSIISEILKGIGKPLQYSLFESVIIKASGIPLIFFLGRMYGLQGAAWAFVASNFVGLLFVSYFAYISLREPLRNAGYEKNSRTDLLRTTLYFSVVSISTVLSLWAGPLIVGHLVGARDIAIFFASFRTAAVLDLVIISIGAVSGPAFVREYASGGLTALRGTVRKTGVIAFAAVALLSVPLIVWAPEVMMIYGGDFSEGATVLRILLIAQWINGPLAVFNLAIIAAKGEKAMAAIAPLAAASGLTATYFLTSSNGLVGAAIGVAATTFIYNAMLGAAFLRKSPL